MNNIKTLFFASILQLCSLYNAFSITPDQLLNIDLKKNYKSKDINELRLIRSMVYAKHGYLFTESELRNYFMSNFKWYDSTIWANAKLGWEGKPVPQVMLSEDELKFVDKIDKLIVDKSENNFFRKDSILLPNINNIGNCFKQEELPEYLGKMLSKYGFAIEKDSLEQLFHLYDKNRYTNTPNFITTDLFLQLFHTYFSFTIKELEKEKLVGLVTLLSESLYKESIKYYTTSTNEQIKDMASFNACFFAIAYTLITDKKLNVPSNIVGAYVNELNKINLREDNESSYFNSFIPYSLFTPRGHYTRTEEQKRYFKAMIWLQIAPYCLSNNKLLKHACFNAFLLNNGVDIFNRPIKQLYKSIYEPIAYLVGDADNISIKDICDVYDKYNINKIELLTQQKIIDVVAMKLREIENEQDKIQPKIKLSCFPKINFMPQRYLVDNDILQQFVDVSINAEKAFPRGVEVFSVLGSSVATDLIYNYYKENKKWNSYDSIYNEQVDKFKTFNNWDISVYNKWLQSLVKLNRVDKNYPYFMKNRGWGLKSLNTSLASWAELKHDVILYGEQPMAAEMGGGGDELPPPITVGYVEPNIEFWNSCSEMLSKNELFLAKYNLKTEELSDKTNKIRGILDFFINASLKEINHQSLTSEEYNRIEIISGEFDYLSLNMLNPYVNYNDWYDVKGPDKTIALIADIYTRNVPDCPKDAILHSATGLGNKIYVVVEIDKRLYLTKGATFSYYEFPYSSRLTDETWLEMVKSNSIEPIDWMKEITVTK
jgi:hypothetical protein